MIHIKNISLAFGERPLFDDISCTIMPTQKIGLVGRNGSGKTTLLKAIANQQALDDGTIAKPKEFRCAFMPQEVVLESEQSVLDEALAAFPVLFAAHQTRQKIEQQLDNGASNNASLLEHYAHAQQILTENQFEATIARIKKMILGLGFFEAQFDMSVSTLSVGWKMRLLLAQLLLQDADFYLFDEPTNHLDLPAKDWFLSFLRNASFGFILVCHDQYFLDYACNMIGALQNGKLKFYQGNYSYYQVQAAQEQALEEKRFEEQQKYIKRQIRTIERFRAKATKAAMAQSMLKSLDKIERIECTHNQKNVRINLPTCAPSGKTVLEIKQLSFAFNAKPIFEAVDMQILRGQRMAIVAPNGTGKTTLLQVIMGKHKQQNGSMQLGYNVMPAFFEQDQQRSLNQENTIFDEVSLACTTSEARSRVRALLGAFLFSSDDVFKPIKILSGGEKNRVAMAKILCQPTNFLILDEPTNHLDLQSKEMLLAALQQFKGTILFVSHDHHFLNHLATHIFELTAHGSALYEGNYEAYCYQKNANSSHNEEPKQSKKTQKMLEQTNNKVRYAQRKQLQQIESKIKKLERALHEQAKHLNSLGYHSKKYQETAQQISLIEQELATCMATWETLMQKK